MDVGHKYWNHYFKVMISKPRTWIRWGYAKDGEKAKPTHTEPKLIVLGIHGKDYNHTIRLPFKLGDGFESDGVKYHCKVADEVEAWGWKTVNEESPNANGSWATAGSRDACLRAAKKSFKRHGLIPDGFIVTDEEGNFEHLPLPKDWQEFAKEAYAAVDSWQSGKGWPKDWKGC